MATNLATTEFITNNSKSFVNPNFNDDSGNNFNLDPVLEEQSNQGTSSVNNDNYDFYYNYTRLRSSTIIPELKIVIFKRTYSMKGQTYLNIKKLFNMFKPFAVFFILLIILITIFRVDLIVNIRDI
jgi:hypothetical protein